MTLPESLFYNLINKYNLHKNKNDINRIKEVRCLEQYGVKHSSQREDVKAKFTSEENNNHKKEYFSNFNWAARNEKSKQTKLEKYNDENYNNRDKYHTTCKDRYGVDNYTQSKDFIDKSMQTRISNCGSVKASYQKGLEASRKTCIERYGVAHNWSNKDPKLNGQATLIKKYGVTNASYIPGIADKRTKTAKHSIACDGI